MCISSQAYSFVEHAVHSYSVMSNNIDDDVTGYANYYASKSQNILFFDYKSLHSRLSLQYLQVCSPNPCKNNAYCCQIGIRHCPPDMIPGAVQCYCLNGYSGDFCEIEINECLASQVWLLFLCVL